MKDNNESNQDSATGRDEPSTIPVDSDPSPLKEFGPYRLLQRIGQGGMGEVYLAEQKSPIRRRVAIKLIKVGMDTREVVARFESERQALAMMNHPNVASIYDAGCTDTGRPYFVMEYVPGEPITEYCDRNRLNLRSRIELFVSVCLAIHHAHQKGIIHRDIKPTNVLVTVADGKPTPKVIDFGVAKATQTSLADKTIYTSQGQLIGTPAYMSPEQAEMTGLNIDTTSDVYSLGVLLYELLAGALPFDTKTLVAAGVAEIHRIIREVDPPRPSTKISTLGDQASVVASRRCAEPYSLRKQLDGELDWIVMRAMEKDRTRRYPSASEFAADIERYLNGSAIAAGPPGMGYRLTKTIRKYRLQFVALGAVVAALAVGLTVAASYAYRAERGRRELVWQNYVSRLQTAQLALSANEVRTARQALADCPTELRGWEWDYLHHRSDQSIATILEAQEPPVDFQSTDVEWLGATGQLAVGTRSGSVYVVDSSRPDTPHEIAKFGGSIGDLASSPDGLSLAVLVPADSLLHVLDARTGKLLAGPRLHERRANGRIMYVRGGSEILHGDAYGLSRYDAVTGSPLGRMFDDGVRASQRFGSFSASTATHYMNWESLDDGAAVIACTGKSIGIDIYQTRSGISQISPHLSVRYTPLLSCLATRNNLIALSGPSVADSNGASGTTSIDVSDTETGREFQFRSSSLPASALEFSHDCKLIFVGRNDGAIEVWDAGQGSLVQSLTGHASRIQNLRCDPAGRFLASSSVDGEVRLWDMDRLEDDLSAAKSQAFSIERDPKSGKLFCEFWRDGQGIIYEMAGGRLERRYTLANGSNAWRIVADSLFECGARSRQYAERAILRGERELHTQIVAPDGTTRAHYESVPPDYADIATLSISEDGGCFAFSRSSMRVGAYAETRSAADSSNTSRVARHNLQIRDFRTGAIMAAVDDDSAAVSAIAIAPDNSYVAVGSENGAVYLMDIAREHRLYLRPRHSGRVSRILFTDDGTALITAAADQTLAVWRVPEGKLTKRFIGCEPSADDMCVDQASGRLFTVSRSGPVRVWDYHTGDLLLTMRDIPNRGGVPDIEISTEDGAVDVLGYDGMISIGRRAHFNLVMKVGE